MDSSTIGRRSFLAAAATATAGLSGCGLFESGDPRFGNGGDNPTEGLSVRMGAAIPQTGALGEFGQELEDGIRLVEHQLEAVHDPNWELEVEVRDTESDPDTAVSVVEELVDEGFEAIVGPGASESAAAVTDQVLVEDEIVACSPLASANLLDIEHEGLFFSAASRTRLVGRAIGRPVSMNRISSASILHSTTAYGTRLDYHIEDELDARGTDVQARVPVEPGDSYESKLDEAFADDPEGIVLACNPGEGIPLLETIYSDYEAPTVFVTDRLRINDLPSRVGSGLTGANVVSLRPEWDISSMRGSSDDEEDDESEDDEAEDDGEGEDVEFDEDADRLDRFSNAFQHRYDRFPSLHAGLAFDATVVMLLAAVAAGEDNYDGREIANRLEGVVNYRSNIEGASVDTHGHDEYWEGLARINQGIQNSYSGATGGFTYSNGVRQSPDLQSAEFAPDTEEKFEELLPIPN